ncbi:MAG: hypothetical protein WCH34_05140 [Bacteroidota bacterium]
MEIYDSPEEKELSQNLTENLKQVRAFFDGMTAEEQSEYFQNITKSIQGWSEILTPLVEKAKHEPLSEDEYELLIKGRDAIKKTQEEFETMYYALNYSLRARADGMLFHLKEQAEKGDEKAKEVYDDLYPKYREQLESDISSPEVAN